MFWYEDMASMSDALVPALAHGRRRVVIEVDDYTVTFKFAVPTAF